MQPLELVGGAVAFEGAVEVEKGDGWVRPWRVPTADHDLHHPAVVLLAGWPAGVRLRFATDSAAVRIGVEHVDSQPGVEFYATAYDCTVDGVLAGTVTAESGATGPATITFDDLPGDGLRVIEVWLPSIPGVRVHAVEINDGAVAETAVDTRPRWVHYGSSISHCLEAPSPTRTWPALAAAARGWHLTALGLAGNCVMDPMIGRLISGLRADRISMKLGINVHGSGTARARIFEPMVHGLITSIRDGHPDTPLLIASPVLCPDRETVPDVSGRMPDGSLYVEPPGDMSLERMRETLAHAVAVHRRRGDDAIGYLDGLALLGPDDAEGLSADGVHPTPAGYETIAAHFATHAWPD